MWKLKVLLQFILARLPFGEHVNYILQRLKGSHQPARIRANVLEILATLKQVNYRCPIEGRTVMEIGTGWDAVGALCLYLFGAERIFTYDHVRHVRPALVLRVVEQFHDTFDEIARITRIPEARLMERCGRLKGSQNILDTANIRYIAPGDATKTGLPDSCMDLIYSHAVLEHVPERIVHAIAKESQRILRPQGMAFHFIGYGDHYSSGNGVSGVNFLQYSPRLWAFFIHNRISYHNRLREKQFVEIFESHGASVRIVSHSIRQWDIDALKTLNLHETFSGMTAKELAVHNGLLAITFTSSEVPIPEC